MSFADPSPSLFDHLRSQILSIALALYGTNSPSPSSAFDILTYTAPVPPSLSIMLDGRRELPETIYGVALITYTSLGKFTKWQLLAKAESSGNMGEAMGKLLEDMRAGMGSVIVAMLPNEGAQSKWEGAHRRVPDLAIVEEM